MKINKESINYDDEFEKLYGTPHRVTLFEDEDYENGLRSEILSQVYKVYNKNKLPFSDFKLISYIDFKREDVIEKEKSKNRLIFFLRQEKTGRGVICNAAGYYSPSTSSFILLPYSHIVKVPRGIVPEGYSRKGEIIDGKLYTISPLEFSSPADAASYVLGHKASLEEWSDTRGKGLLVYYKNLLYSSPAKQEDKVKEDKQVIVSYNNPILYLKIKFICDASGYYDSNTGYFFILKYSIISPKCSPEFENSERGQARKKLIDANCIFENGFYHITKDSKCRDAFAATAYVIGMEPDKLEWRTSEGKTLYDLYPDTFKSKEEAPANPRTWFQFSRKKENVPTERQSDQIHYFSIVRSGIKNCTATGYFDTTTKQFILKAGSVWAKEESSSFLFSAAGIMRRANIKKSCRVEFYGFKQYKDIVCDSPGQAASYVLGEETDGWNEWKDNDGNSLQKYLNMNSKL